MLRRFRRLTRLTLTLAAFALFVAVTSVSMPRPAQAAAPTNRGLFITPIRQFVTLSAGTSKDSSVTIANYTEQPISVSFSVKTFSVADYDYDFSFNEVSGKKLVDLNVPDVILKPGANKVVPYTVTVPPGSTPGGRYYTLLATATSLDSKSGSLREQVQAASLLYITVEGSLNYANNIGATSMQKLVFGNRIGFTMDVSNTGNTHYFMFLSAQLSGPLTNKSRTTGSHLLLPLKTRHLESSLPSPVLPGVYQATYGYRTEHTPEITRTARVTYLPPWFIAVVLLLAWAGWKIRSRRKQHKSAPPAVTD